VSAHLPPKLLDACKVFCYRCGKPADRVEDAEGLRRLLSPRVLPPPRSGMVGVAVRIAPGGIASVTAADLVPLGPLCGRHEPQPPGGPPYDLLASMR
jgi:hypothetical protein